MFDSNSAPAFCPICDQVGGSIRAKASGVAEVVPCAECQANSEILLGGFLFGTWSTAVREYGLTRGEGSV